jgi:hypothetical protein
MLIKLKTSLKNINYKLFIALLIMGLCPTIYTTIRVFWLGQLPGEWSFSIAGQLSWVNLIYEVINEGFIDRVFEMIQGCLLASWNMAGRPARNKVVATTFDATAMKKLCNTIRAYGSPII